MSLQKTNFQKLKQIITDINNIPESSKSKVSGYMDLNLDLLGQENDVVDIALSHYYKHPTGDMIPDPDMTMEIHLVNQTVEPITYQDIYHFDDVYRDGIKNERLSHRLNEFLSTWLTNLIEQGHVLK